MSDARAVFVEAPSRLHMGLIDPGGELGRRFGGIGAALEAPSLLIEARPAEKLSAEGDHAERLLVYARRFLDRHRIEGGAWLRVHRAIPAHSGLGSGTQLALATARALAALFDRPFDAPSLAEATGRVQRSGIGTWAFEQGGFLLEGGRRVPGDGPAPLLLRRAMPADWRCVLAIPDVPPGLSGPAEEGAFRDLPPPPAELVGRIAHLILMVVLPALVEEDLPAFGSGLTEVQRLVGEMFRPVQGDRFAHARLAELVDDLLAGGALGAGQSSWGPAVYGLVRGEEAAQDLAGRIERRLSGRGIVLATGFNNHGARCWTADASPAAR
ncbi:MAG: beta-ribofuranosylaminobenzene 5'-phosphate synthase family protein [Solirubrobacterales bacterium]|jgi:beta-RFAP synthase